MHNKDLLRGALVRLCATDPAEVAEAYAAWAKDSELSRLMDSDPPGLLSLEKTREQTESDWPLDDANNVMFTIRAVEDDRIVGFANVDYVNYVHGDTYMGIGIMERALWGTGAGQEALNLLLGYAFTQLNLYRVTLTVFAYNQRAIRAYEKAGFTVEGCHREFVYRAGKRWDMLEMGILRREWLARQES